MWSLKDSPIKQKLIRVIMLTSSVVLMITAGALISYEIYSYREVVRRIATTQARVIANTATAALSYDVPEDARDILAAMRADPTVIASAFYKEGRLFAFYPPLADPVRDLPNEVHDDTSFFERGHLLVFQPVVLDGTRVGTLYLKYSMQPLYDRLKLYGTMVAGLLAISLFVAYGLAAFLQKRISEPILGLAGTARRISERKDYSVRGRKFGEDELGLLTDAFNDMLSQIQKRDLALIESGERLNLALRASQTGTWDWEIQSNVLVWDEFTLALFGLPEGTLRGTFETFLERVHPSDREKVQQAAVHAIQQRTEFDMEFRIVWPDGTVHNLSSRGRAFYDAQGRPVRMSGVHLDITQRKRAEEEIRRLNAELEERVQVRTSELAATNRELEAFTYSVSHDLRAPLRHIDGFAQILQEEFAKQLDPSALNYLRRIRKGTQNMGQLVDDLLNFARVGRLELERLPTDLNAVIDDVIAELKIELKDRSIEWQIGKLPAAECDPGLIKQVFTNLLSNAIKYTRPRDRSIIQIDAAQFDNVTAIFIRDNGVGFDMKYVDKVFGVFQRLHRAEEFEGTGVGLATVQRIIQKHGGRIWADAELGKGATFYFTLGPGGIKTPD